jgi:hypothetical protein
MISRQFSICGHRGRAKLCLCLFRITVVWIVCADPSQCQLLISSNKVEEIRKTMFRTYRGRGMDGF